MYHVKRLGFDLDQDNDSKLHVSWLNGTVSPEYGGVYKKVTKDSISYLASKLERLEKLKKVKLEPLFESKNESVTQHELEGTMRYAEALTTALAEAVKAAPHNVTEQGDAGKVYATDAKHGDKTTKMAATVPEGCQESGA